MTYTGEVTRGGAPDVRDLAGLTVTKVSVGPMDNNAYLLRSGDDQLLIDAADDAGTLVALAGAAGLRTIVTTHRHADHWQALTDVVAATGAESLAHIDDAAEIPLVNRTLRDGEHLTVGDATLEVIQLVGHTPGSIALLYQEPAGPAHLWTGDSLFPGGVGNTRKNAANFASLINDVEHKIFDRFGDDTWFYPGHGKDSTLGAERPHLPEWRARGW
ncbi:hydrolase [Paractinoplanes abujensis]|uniref:Glyoxylase-like metal-dependent hydrolase (Beta-lactamase superfamily II) n=1 Tax=Paractinoplanes abujensis TaxID=882441 RepID=A0A7W7G3H1_9ACTN|nr:MBL fold metallo-hydrolase [Actinoplanes abujensis]MBB4694210.1 glyoxylase-like metal-dependent hydrolase (beta-lactamase superfamily II) [Actinoplanes abujensis]GID20575.1 hydrolase [Actinoplanes abujensis]